ncbi:MAG TPA: hypothetical protein VM287_12035, partial [Egibacteraceae bacterium]|nr:hypothetical protein [Egibacteraceae bacterium]
MVIIVALTATGAAAQSTPETDAVPVAAQEPLSSQGLEFVPVAPCAVFDTRFGSDGFAGKLEAEGSRAFTVAGAVPAVAQGGEDCPVPPAGTAAVALNLVATGAVAAGNLQVAAEGTAPRGGVVTYVAGVSNSTALPVQVNASGALRVHNTASNGPVHVRGVVL